MDKKDAVEQCVDTEYDSLLCRAYDKCMLAVQLKEPVESQADLACIWAHVHMKFSKACCSCPINFLNMSYY